MKKITYLLAASLFLLLTGFSNTPVGHGNTNSELGTFVIEKSKQPLIYNANILRTYDITYENSGLKLRVGVDESKKRCKTYLVVAGDLAIQYNCKDGIFGANMVEDKYVEDGIPSTDSRIDRAEYFRQKVLTQIPKDEIDHVKLISVFFPKLISEEVLYAFK